MQARAVKFGSLHRGGWRQENGGDLLGGKKKQDRTSQVQGEGEVLPQRSKVTEDT